MTILLVEDDNDVRASMRDVLELDNHAIVEANSITAAKSILADNEIAIAIVDRNLPDGSAEELLPDLRNQVPPTEVVVVTGYADLESTISAIRAGAADYILKPVHPDALRGSITRILEQRRVAKKLYEEHQLANQVFSTTEAIILILDMSGRIVRFNPYFAKAFGWSLESVKGRDWFDTCLPECEQPQVRETFCKTVEQAVSTVEAHAVFTSDGQKRFVR